MPAHGQKGPAVQLRTDEWDPFKPFKYLSVGRDWTVFIFVFKDDGVSWLGLWPRSEIAWI
jgi:hypothetical protein